MDLQATIAKIPTMVMGLSVTAIIILSFLLLLLFLFVYTNNYMTVKGGPPEYGFSTLTNSINFFFRQYNFVKEAAKKHDCFTIKIFSPAGISRMTFLIGAEAHSLLFKASDKDVDLNEPYKVMKYIFGPGLVYDAPPDIRNQQFRFLATCLQPDMLKTYVSHIVTETESYFKEFPDSGETDLFIKFGELIILTASRALMGKEIRQNLFKEVGHLYKALDESINLVGVFLPTAPTEKNNKRDEARKQMVEIFSKLIKKRRETVDESQDDVLSFFMSCKYRDGTKLSDDEISGMLIALLFAGQHTSSTTSTWAAYEFLQNKQIWNKVIEEQREIYKKYNGEITFTSITEMKYLEKVIKEALRLHPPIYWIMRKVLVAQEYKNFTIPEGDIISAVTALCHMDPKIYPEPEKFDPERWNDDKVETYPLNSFVAFGAGKHSCMGQKFGMMQVKAVFSVWFRNFDIELIGKPEPDYSAMMITPKPLKARFKRINPRY